MPSLLNPLSRASSDANVVSVYVPTSVAAGGSAATVEFSDMDTSGKSTAPFEVILTSGAKSGGVSSDLRESTFRAKFGNMITVVERSDATTGDIFSVSATIEDLARVVVGDAGTVTQEKALATVTFSRDDGFPVTLNAATLLSPVVTVADTIFRTFEIGPGNLDPNERFAAGMLVVEETASGTLPLLATGNLTGDAATPGSFIANPEFPGFLVSADNSDVGEFDRSFYTDQAGDTISELEGFRPSLNLNTSTSSLSQIQGVTLGEIVLTFTDLVFGPQSPFLLNEAAFADPLALDAVFDQSLAARTGTTAAIDDETRGLVADALGLAADEVTLVAANIPFEVSNRTFGRPVATLAMQDPGERRKILGRTRDTLSVTVAADQWIPTDPLFVIEQLEVSRTRDVSGEQAIVVTDDGTPDGGAPVTETRRLVTFQLDLTCGSANATCNVVSAIGAGSGRYVGVRPGDNLHLAFFAPFTNQSEFTFVPRGAVSPEDVLAEGLSIKEQMELIQAVPNPYLFFSEYETTSAARRIMFTHLPPDGELRIYTIAGQFLQEIDWQPSDLVGNGDLFWDLQTREGNDISGGLFIFVVTARDPATGESVKKLGKFVVIR